MNELDYLKRLLDLNIDCNFKVHLQIDTGFNRLGFKDKNEVKTAVDMINGSNFVLEGQPEFLIPIGTSRSETSRSLHRLLI